MKKILNHHLADVCLYRTVMLQFTAMSADQMWNITISPSVLCYGRFKQHNIMPPATAVDSVGPLKKKKSKKQNWISRWDNVWLHGTLARGLRCNRLHWYNHIVFCYLFNHIVGFHCCSALILKLSAAVRCCVVPLVSQLEICDWLYLHK